MGRQPEKPVSPEWPAGQGVAAGLLSSLPYRHGRTGAGGRHRWGFLLPVHAFSYCVFYFISLIKKNNFFMAHSDL